MNDTTLLLADALGILISSLGDHPVLKGVAGVDAMMDLADYTSDPGLCNAHAMAQSAEDLIDDLRISKLPETPELVAAEAALQARLLS